MILNSFRPKPRHLFGILFCVCAGILFWGVRAKYFSPKKTLAYVHPHIQSIALANLVINGKAYAKHPEYNDPAINRLPLREKDIGTAGFLRHLVSKSDIIDVYRLHVRPDSQSPSVLVCMVDFTKRENPNDPRLMTPQNGGFAPYMVTVVGDLTLQPKEVFTELKRFVTPNDQVSITAHLFLWHRGQKKPKLGANVYMPLVPRGNFK